MALHHRQATPSLTTPFRLRDTKVRLQGYRHLSHRRSLPLRSPAHAYLGVSSGSSVSQTSSSYTHELVGSARTTRPKRAATDGEAAALASAFARAGMLHGSFSVDFLLSFPSFLRFELGLFFFFSSFFFLSQYVRTSHDRNDGWHEISIGSSTRHKWIGQ